MNGTLVKDFETAQKAAKTGAAASSAGKSPKKAAKAAKKPAAAAAAAAAAKQKKVKVEKSVSRVLVSRRFPLIPLQNCLVTPELQWQIRG